MAAGRAVPSSSLRILLITVDQHSGAEQLNVPIHHETQSWDTCEAKWFPPLIRDPINQANGVSRYELGLLVCRADAYYGR